MRTTLQGEEGLENDKPAPKKNTDWFGIFILRVRGNQGRIQTTDTAVSHLSGILA
jgi:hypothetical protein